MSYHFYNGSLKKNANKLRTQSVSIAEKYIWKSLLSRNRMGVKFKRQRPIGNFIVDFFAQEIGLIIEIDGNSHWAKPEYDAYRQQKLESYGYVILRFEEGVVINNLEGVANKIEHGIYCLKEKMNAKSE